MTGMCGGPQRHAYRKSVRWYCIVVHMAVPSTAKTPGSPTPGRRRRRAGRSKAETLQAAADVIAERGAEATRFIDVSEASGVPVSTLQYYFGNRVDLLHAAFDHVASNELEAMADSLRSSGDPWEQLRRLLVIGVAQGDQGDPVWRIWVEYWRAAIRDDELREGARSVYRRWRGLVEQVVRTGIESGRFRSDADPVLAAFQLTVLADGIAVPIVLQDPFLTGGGPASAEIVIDVAARLLGVTR
jgi:AcrR family transcriptional regulator